MLRQKKSRNLSEIYHSMYVYSDVKSNWVKIHPTEIGDIKHSARSTDHNGWLMCDGRSLSRTEYADLFAVIGTAFGSVDANHFNIPNPAGRVLGVIGEGTDDETGRALTERDMGEEAGEEVHELTLQEMPKHNHTSNADGTPGLISSGTNTAGAGLDTTAGEPDLYTTPQALSIDYAGGTNLLSPGESVPHNNMQPTLFIGNVFILAKYYVANAHVVA
jgi:microcystin-dependent protein